MSSAPLFGIRLSSGFGYLILIKGGTLIIPAEVVGRKY
jgi:hypothetical protein